MNKEEELIATRSISKICNLVRDKAVDDCIEVIQNFTPKSFPTTFEKIIEELQKLKSNVNNKP